MSDDETDTRSAAANNNCGDRTAIELFLAGIESWKAGMRQILIGYLGGVAHLSVVIDPHRPTNSIVVAKRS